MNRRHWLMGGAGAAALAAGVAWQQRRGTEAPPAETAAGGAEAGVWQMRFDQPDGGVLDMATLRGKPLLLNFWGTWCPPCVKEMPELDRFARQFGPQGWQVVGLAVDNPKAVREFLARTPVSYTIGLAGFEGSELTRALGNTQSGLPFTVAFNRQGAVSHRKAGATTLEELSGWARGA
jgi:thiol-disulfide isomerase/thioredoxin